jgi:hypothetical protein
MPKTKFHFNVIVEFDTDKVAKMKIREILAKLAYKTYKRFSRFGDKVITTVQMTQHKKNEHGMHSFDTLSPKEREDMEKSVRDGLNREPAKGEPYTSDPTHCGDPTCAACNIRVLLKRQGDTTIVSGKGAASLLDFLEKTLAKQRGEDMDTPNLLESLNEQLDVLQKVDLDSTKGDELREFIKMVQHAVYLAGLAKLALEDEKIEPGADFEKNDAARKEQIIVVGKMKEKLERLLQVGQNMQKKEEGEENKKDEDPK